jgi:release factor glutamine methyltransferase
VPMAAPAEQWILGKLLETAGGYLGEKGSSSPRLDAELLLAQTLGLERIELYTQYDRPLVAAEVDAYRELVARRAAHEPVAYILGRAYFRHLCLQVGPAVLIPRPETEELVEVALESLRRRPVWQDQTVAEDSGGPAAGAGKAPHESSAQIAAPGASARPLVADLGTGSGVIALSLAQEAGVRVLAIDNSAEALAVAARNTETLSLERSVELLQADLLCGVPDSSLHLVVSNPPYVTSGDLTTLAPDVRLFEPASALDAGPDGLAVMRRLLPEASRALRPGGTVLLEVGEQQAAAVEALAREAGFASVSVHKDLSGKDRIVEATMPGAFSISIDEAAEPRLVPLARALEAGAIIGIPTDTVYGLAAHWGSAAGVRALFAAKGRSEEQPVAALFASVDHVKRALPDLEPSAAKVMEALLPGPYTFVVATQVTRAPLVGTADSLGVRVPAHPALLKVIESLGTPLAATSANATGESDAATLADADPMVLSHCSVVFVVPAAWAPGASPASQGAEEGAGEVAGVAGVASTVVDIRPLATGAAPVILREGTVPGLQVLERIAALGL